MRYKVGKPTLMICTALRAAMICQALSLSPAAWISKKRTFGRQKFSFCLWAIRDSNPGPTGYTPLRRKAFRLWCYAPCSVSPNRRGAICARLACASTDSLALDYVASGSTPFGLDTRSCRADNKKRQPQGLPLFIGGPSGTRTRDRPVMSREL